MKAKKEAESKQNKLEAVKKALLEDLAQNPIPTDLTEREAFLWNKLLLVNKRQKLMPLKLLYVSTSFGSLPNPTDILGIYQNRT